MTPDEVDQDELDQSDTETVTEAPVPHVVNRKLNARKTPGLKGAITDVVEPGTVVHVVETKTVGGAEWAKTDAGVWHLAEHLDPASSEE